MAIVATQDAARGSRDTAASGPPGREHLEPLLDLFDGDVSDRGGAMQDLMGGLASGGASGGLVGGLAGSDNPRAPRSHGGLAAALRSQLDEAPAPAPEPRAAQEAAAALLLRAAMLALRACETNDDQVRARLASELTPEEAALVDAECDRAPDMNAMVAERARGMDSHIYAVSAFVIDPASRSGTVFLRQLGQKLELNDETVARIHARLVWPEPGN